MNSQSFVETQINQLSQEFSYLKFRYKVDEFSKSHYVDYSPNIAKHKKQWQLAVHKIYGQFNELFKGKETLVFFQKGSNALLEIETPCYEKEGALYGISAISYIEDLLESASLYNFADIDILNKYYPNFPPELVYMGCYSATNIVIKQEAIEYPTQAVTHVPKDNLSSGKNAYAMAA